MKRVVSFLFVLCLLCCSAISVSAAEGNADKTVITASVPSSHKITVTAANATVYIDGQSGTEFSVARLSEPKVLIVPDSNYAVKKITLNGEDVTSQLKGGYLKLGKVYEEKILTVDTEKRQAPDKEIRFTVNGSVLKSGNPYPGVTVELRSTLRTTVTDKDGKFTFRDVESGHHSLTVIDDGKVVGYVEFELKAGSATDFTLLVDGSYLVTVPNDTASVDFKFDVTDDGRVEITDVTANTKKPGGSVISPETGDNSNSMFWTVSLIISGLTLCLILVYSKKKNTHKEA